MWDMALWKLEMCIKAGHTDIHLMNFLAGLDWALLADVDVIAQSIMKEAELKIVHQFGWLSISFSEEQSLQPIISHNGGREEGGRERERERERERDPPQY